MRRIPTVVLIALLVLAATSCGGSGEGAIAQNTVPQPCVTNNTGTFQVTDTGNTTMAIYLDNNVITNLNPGGTYSSSVSAGPHNYQVCPTSGSCNGFCSNVSQIVISVCQTTSKTPYDHC